MVTTILNTLGFDVEITSMVRPKGTIPSESGVHATGRALDFVPRVRENSKLQIFESQMLFIADFVNRIFKRRDQKNVLMWHQINRGGWHFHLQVEYDQNYKDLEGVI